jgi:hypothetical protein
MPFPPKPRKTYRNVWRMKYLEHKRRAGLRGILFSLTFDEWSAIWRESGRFDEMGHCGHQYCMARNGDKGAYELGNVRIISCSENNTEQWGNMTPEAQAERRLRQSLMMKDNPQWTGHSKRPEVRAKISAAKKGKSRGPHSPETRERIRAANVATKARQRQMRHAFVEMPMVAY